MKFVSRKILRLGSAISVKVTGALIFSATITFFDGAETHGNVMLRLAWILGLVEISKFGLDQAVVRFGGIASISGDSELARRFFRVSLVVAFVGCVFSVLLALSVNRLSNSMPSGLALMAIPGTTFCLVASSWFKATQRVPMSMCFEFGFTLFVSSALYMSFRPQFDPVEVVAIVSAVVAVVGISSVSMVLKSLRMTHESADHAQAEYVIRTREPDRRVTIGSMMRTLPPLFAGNLITYFQQWGVILLAGALIAATELSWFVWGLRFSALFTLHLALVAAFFSSRLAFAYSRDDVGQFDKVLDVAKRWQMLPAGIGWTALIFFSGIVFLKSDDLGSYFSLYGFWMLTGAFALCAYLGPVQAWLVMLGEEKTVFAIRLLSAALFFLLVSLLSQKLEFNMLKFAFLFSTYVIAQRLVMSAAFSRRMSVFRTESKPSIVPS